MNAQSEPPPKRSTGCLGKGCLIFIALGIVLVVGSFWAVRNVYLSDKPVPIPEAAAPPLETSAATPGETNVAAPSQKSAEVRERLDTLKKAARADEPTAIELTAADINSLIAANRKSSGTASVGINDNILQAQFSIPLNRLDVPFRSAFGLNDRYLNAAATIVAPPGTNAGNVQVSNVTLNGHAISSGLLDWQLPGVGRSLRTYVIKYANKYGVTDGEIRDGKVILHASGNKLR